MADQLPKKDVWEVQAQNVEAEKTWIEKYPDMKERIIQGVKRIEELRGLLSRDIVRVHEDLYDSVRLIDIHRELVGLEDMVTVWEKKLYFETSKVADKEVATRAYKRTEAENQSVYNPRIANNACVIAVLELHKQYIAEMRSQKEKDSKMIKSLGVLDDLRKVSQILSQPYQTPSTQQFSVKNHPPLAFDLEASKTSNRKLESSDWKWMMESEEEARRIGTMNGQKDLHTGTTVVTGEKPADKSEPSFIDNVIETLQQTKSTMESMKKLKDVMASLEQRQQTATVSGNTVELQWVNFLIKKIRKFGMEAHERSEKCIEHVAQLSADATEINKLVYKMEEYGRMANIKPKKTHSRPTEAGHILGNGEKPDEQFVTNVAKTSSGSEKTNGNDDVSVDACGSDKNSGAYKNSGCSANIDG